MRSLKHKNFSKKKVISLLAIVATAMMIVGVMVGVLLNRVAQADTNDAVLPSRFGRMFRNQPSFAPPTDVIRAALLEMGKAGGILDAKDNLAAGPLALIVDPALNVNNPNNPNHTAGTTFFGQFMDHDITFDLSSRLGRVTPPVSAPNGRTPAFDLDTVYGDGPFASPTFYDPTDQIKLRLENGGLFEDLPRDANNRALVVDPRNDQHLILTGILSAFHLFHNRAVDLVRSQSPSINNVNAFNEARRLTTWHYQWLILHEFLPQIIGQDRVNEILRNGRRFYTPLPGRGFIPVEFQVGYRFGHSMVRPSYRANLAGDNGQPFFAFIFDPSQDGKADPSDLRGFARAPRRFIGWQTFFDFNDTQIRRNKLIDTKISSALFNLPLQAIVEGTPPTSLLQRNLLRHVTWQLPSGQTLARAIGVSVLSKNDLAELRSIYPTFDTSTPLWYYILKEAELMERGLRLGPLGSRIIGEVIIGLLQVDPKSYLNVNPSWVPTLPTRTGRPEDFRMVDFLTFARVDPASRGQ
ncbi:heme peroxidase family protein [Aulosira sp. FACHB-615]|uniref:peroxidase family protein n=1 Tax=Aulosira sp. FACHB-615 TaxID=2692777 RepID=UPI001687502D|nr:heme peroxidase family protein [Aulosira sp. FACHB-615]MBD2486837.1 peroxidase [Aulosira sp. FACHB-615]